MAQPKGTKRPTPYRFNLPERRCSFPGCTNTFVPKNANQHYCEADHFLECEVCHSLFLVKRTRLPDPPRTCSSKCGYELRGQQNKWTPERYEKVQQTNLKNLGVPWPMMSSSVQRKSQDTCESHFGVRHPAQSDVIKSKVEEYLLETYNVEFACQLPQCHRYSSESRINKNIKRLFESSGIQLDAEYSLGRYRYDYRVSGTNVLIEINPTVTHNVVFSPWGKPIDSDYHTRKSRCASDNGFVLINIWDWEDPVDLLINLQYSRYFKLDSRDPCLHYYNERTKDHIVSSSRNIDDSLILHGYLPVYDDGQVVEFIY